MSALERIYPVQTEDADLQAYFAAKERQRIADDAVPAFWAFFAAIGLVASVTVMVVGLYYAARMIGQAIRGLVG